MTLPGQETELSTTSDKKRSNTKRQLRNLLVTRLPTPTPTFKKDSIIEFRLLCHTPKTRPAPKALFSPKMIPPSPKVLMKQSNGRRQNRLSRSCPHCLFTAQFVRSARATPHRHRICPALPRAHSLPVKGRGRGETPLPTPRRSWSHGPATRPRRPASKQNDTSELAAHSGWVLPADDGSSLADSVSLLDDALLYQVGAWLARAV